MSDHLLRKLFEDHREERLRQLPVHASRMGDHRYDDQIEDLSVEAREARTGAERQILERLAEEIDYEELSRPAQIDYEIFRHDLQEGIWLWSWSTTKSHIWAALVLVR